MNDFFDALISYGRADSLDFATKLYQRLTERGLRVWFDKKNIPFGVDYQREIDEYGIEKAHNFLFIIGPRSVTSPYCRKEIDLAVKLNKRIIPLLHVKSDEFLNQTNPIISKINWILCEEGINDFEESFINLIGVIQKQADYVEQHTQILAKALEWERHDKQTRYLLVGEEKKQAESWLKIRFKTEQQPCVPTDLHCEFITESTKNANNLMTQVFLSYAEKDESVMEKIRNSLRRESFTVWTNKTDIQMGEALQEAVYRGIEEADNVVYLLSPESLQSEFCQQELEYALSVNKRIIPILVRETDFSQVPIALRDLQSIDLTDNVKEDDYLLDESQLLKILRQDAVYYNEHKILLAKALKWKRQDCNPSILLRGYNLRYAEAWLKVAKQRGQHLPTQLQEEFINESLQQPQGVPLDVFVSYSRTDSDFARKLNDALQMQGKTTWFDQESIASGVDFQQEIYRGIECSDNFLFILSPASVNSPYCAGEVEHAAKLNKRFVTVRHRQVNPASLHPELAKVQWIDFDHQEGDFFANFNQLVRTLDTDREHLRSHTKWSQRAIEWEEKGRSEDLLLRGSEFALAENWLKEAEQHEKQPTPTPLQKEYITASREAIAAARKREKRQVIILWSLLGLVSVGFLFALTQCQRAQTVQEAQINSISRFSLLLSEADRKFEALIEAIRAEKQLQKQLNRVNPATQSLVLTALQAAVYGHGFRERNQLVRHVYAVLGVSFSPDGKTIASSSGDNTVKLWSLDGNLVGTLKGHKNQIDSVVWSPDGQTIATASWDKTIRLWSQDGKPLRSFEGHRDHIYSVAWSPDGKTIASASEDKEARLWSLDGKLLKIFRHSDGVSSISFSPDGQTIATGSWDKIIRLWSLNGKLLRIFWKHKAPIYSVAWSPDGKTIASASGDNSANGDNTVKLWSLDGKLLRTLKGHIDWVKSVSFSPDSKTIASASVDKTVRLWSRDTGIPQGILKGHNNWVNSVSFSPDGKTIASASWDNTVRLWNLNRHELKTLKTDNKGNKGVSSVSFSPDGKTIASAGADKTIKLWSREGKLLHIFRGHTDGVSGISFSPDGQMIASADAENIIKLWSVEGRRALPTFMEHTNTKGDSSVSFSIDGQTIAFVTRGDNLVKLWRLGTQEPKVLTGHTDRVSSVTFSPDGKTIASASEDRTVKLWSVEGKPLQTLKGHIATVKSVSFSPDGKTLASASSDKTVKLWSVEGKKLLHTLEGHTATVKSVSFSPDGKTLASASEDNTVKLWSIEGKELQTFTGHKAQVNSVSFSFDGKTLASASDDGTVILWNLKDLSLDKLMQDACDWVGDYLKYSAAVEKSDRHLCDGIGKK